MKAKLVNRFENEVIELDVKSEEDICIAPKFKEIRVKLKNGEFKIYSAVTYEVNL